MSVRQVYFTQDCQVCGRPMRVRLELLGKRICCAHCNASCHAGGVGQVNGFRQAASTIQPSRAINPVSVRSIYRPDTDSGGGRSAPVFLP